jgi:hypothetical protein
MTPSAVDTNAYQQMQVNMEQRPPAFARIVNIRFAPESFAPAFEHFRDVSAPLVLAQSGSRGILGAGSHATGNTWTISFWQTRADLDYSNSPPAVVEAMAVYTQWMISPFSVQTYAILQGQITEPDTEGAAGEWARITTVIPEPNQAEAAIAALRERLTRLETRCAGSRGTLLMAQQAGNRLIAIELWSSAGTLAASDPEAMSQDQHIRVTVPLQGSPLREEAEVFGRYG